MERSLLDILIVHCGNFNVNIHHPVSTVFASRVLRERLNVTGRSRRANVRAKNSPKSCASRRQDQDHPTVVGQCNSGEANASTLSVNFPPMPDRQRQHNKAAVLDFANHAEIADPITPKPR